MSAATLATTRPDRIRDLGYDYGAQPRRDVLECNLCGDHRFINIVHRDRYRYAVRASACVSCGLVFLNPVMTAEAYGRFYQDVYRPLVSAYHGRLINAETIQDEQRTYAEERATFLEPFLSGLSERTLLDIGGSTGVVAEVLAGRFGLRATLIDPAPLEVDEARRRGLETISGLVEEHDFAGRRFGAIAMFQTVDHLIDVRGTLVKIRGLLADDGVLFVDIVDFRAAYLRSGSVEEAIKIDHPYYLTEPTMEALFARAGFSPARIDYASDHLHVGYVCRPVAPRPEAMPDPAWVAFQRQEIRAIQNLRAAR